MSTPTPTKRPTPTQVAASIIAAAEASNWKLSMNPDSGSLSVTRTFKPGDIESYIAAEAEYSEVLSLAPQTRPGSEWGTDGASVGGAVGLDNGYFRMNRSGISKPVLAQLVKLGVGKTKAPIKGMIVASKAATLFTQGPGKQPTPTKEGAMTKSKTAAKATKATKATKRTPARSVAVTKTPTAVSPVSSSADVDRIKAIFDNEGTTAGRVEACRIAALEGAAKKEALKSGAPRPAMPVNDWMATDDYQQRRTGTMSTTTSNQGSKGSGSRPSSTKAAGKGGKAKGSGQTFPNCPLCGFKFTTPKAKCSSKAACEKRQAEAKGKGGAKASTAKKSAPAKAAAKKSTGRPPVNRTTVTPRPKKAAAAKRTSKPAAKRVTKRVAA